MSQAGPADTRLAGRSADESRGPNWVHGTLTNPIVRLAAETGTRLALLDEQTRVYTPTGQVLDNEQATDYFDIIWDIIAEAFKYSNRDCDNIPPHLSLLDFFKQEVCRRELNDEKRSSILDLAEMWGSFTGDPLNRQSLKWFWLEECLDGGA